MAPTLIALALLALGVGVVVWFVRKKPDVTTAEAGDDDITWNDPMTPGEPARSPPPSKEPRP